MLDVIPLVFSGKVMGRRSKKASRKTFLKSSSMTKIPSMRKITSVHKKKLALFEEIQSSAISNRASECIIFPKILNHYTFIRCTVQGLAGANKNRCMCV
jgi:hypothetical protein